MELRSRGWSVRAAAREVGMSRTCAANWSRGYKTYRSGQVVGYVPPLDRLAVRKISARYLSQDERIEIADLRGAGLSIRRIAQQIGRSHSGDSVACVNVLTAGPDRIDQHAHELLPADLPLLFRQVTAELQPCDPVGARHQ